MKRIEGVSLLGLDPAHGPVDIDITEGRIAAIAPAATTPKRRVLALPALVNAHDHARPLSTSSFGAGNKPLESWLLALGAMPAIDPYQGALAAFGRAARAGAGSVIAHYTRLHGPMSPLSEVREVARAAKDIGIRVTFALYMRDQNPLVYGSSDSVLMKLPANYRNLIEAQFCAPLPTPEAQIERVEEIAASCESEMFRVQFGPNGPQWCSDHLLRAIASASQKSGRRIHMHLLETQYQRKFADETYEQGVVQYLADIGLLNERITLAHCVYARPGELDLIAKSGATIATNPSSNLHLRSGIAPIGDAIRRGCRIAVGVDGSALDEDDDILREVRLGHFLHGGWGFDGTISRADWLTKIVKDGRFANEAPGPGALTIGAPADILMLDLDLLDRDAIMPVEPLDLLFGRANRAHILRLMVAGQDIVRDGKLVRIDLEAVEADLRADYRQKMPSRSQFLTGFQALDNLVREFYYVGQGCC